MPILKKLKYTLVFLVLLFGCKTYAQEDVDKYKVYSKVLEKLPLMPPPSIKIVTNDSLLKRYIDSLGREKVHIYVLDKTVRPSDFDVDRLAPEDREKYEKLVVQLNNSEVKKIDAAKFSHKSNETVISVSIAPDLEYDPLVTNWYLAVSDIILDKSKGIGILYVMQALSELSGDSRVYLLEYIENKWKIYMTIVLDIS
jgi:hypothetical protein